MNANDLAAIISIVAGQSGVTIVILWAWARDRRECAGERRQLVDRVIARHTGEVIALDRTEKPKPKGPLDPDRLIEGLS